MTARHRPGLRGLFVTGTDTGAGKTVVAAALCAALRARGDRVAAFKPVVTGLDDEPDERWPPDHELLARACGWAGPAEETPPGERPAPGPPSPDGVAPYTFGPPASPHLAARLAGVTIEPARLVTAARSAGEGAEVLVVEGVGGLLVPLTLGYAVRDLAMELALPLVVAARPGLGTINHTLLTLEAARAAGLTVAAVVLTPWPAEPTAVEADNRATIERLGGVPVAALPHVERGDPALLERAGRELPLELLLGE
jgi:dethiobiotin synthetase